MKRLLAITMLAILVGLSLVVNNAYSIERFSVQVIVNDKSGNSEALVKALRSEIDSLLADGQEIAIDTFSTEQFLKLNTSSYIPNLRVTVGTIPTLRLVKYQSDIPIYSVLVPHISFDQIFSEARKTKDNKGYNGKLSVIYLDQPFARRFALTKQLIPNANEVGIVLGPSTAPYKEVLLQAAADAGLQLNIEIIQSAAELVPALERVLQSSQALLAVLDPLVFNRSNAQTVLLTSYRYRVPIIGISPSYTNAGALAAVYSTPEQIGRQLAREIKMIYEAPEKELPGPKYPDYFSITINKQIAHSLRINLVDERTLEQKLMMIQR